MSLLEWLGEARNPGPVGHVEAGPPDVTSWNPRVIVIRGVLAAGLALGVLMLIAMAARDARQATMGLIAVAAYCGIAYWVAPRPRYDNVGLLGGLIDHPFRWSDDANRFLIGASILLGPGRFITVSLRELARYRRGLRVMVLPPRE